MRLEEFWVWWANTRSPLDFSAFGCCILFKENRLCVKSWIFLFSVWLQNKYAMDLLQLKYVAKTFPGRILLMFHLIFNSLFYNYKLSKFGSCCVCREWKRSALGCRQLNIMKMKGILCIFLTCSLKCVSAAVVLCKTTYLSCSHLILPLIAWKYCL